MDFIDDLLNYFSQDISFGPIYLVDKTIRSTVQVPVFKQKSNKLPDALQHYCVILQPSGRTGKKN